jgi:hypothetical protein
MVFTVWNKIAAETPLRPIRNAVTAVKHRYGRETPLRSRKICYRHKKQKRGRRILLCQIENKNLTF